MAKIEQIYTSLEQDTELVQSLLENGFKRLNETLFYSKGSLGVTVENNLTIKLYDTNSKTSVFEWTVKSRGSYNNTKELANKISDLLTL